MFTIVPKGTCHFTLAVLVLPAYVICLEAERHHSNYSTMSLMPMPVSRQNCASVLVQVHFAAAKEMATRFYQS